LSHLEQKIYLLLEIEGKIKDELWRSCFVFAFGDLLDNALRFSFSNFS